MTEVDNRELSGWVYTQIKNYYEENRRSDGKRCFCFGIEVAYM